MMLLMLMMFWKKLPSQNPILSGITGKGLDESQILHTVARNALSFSRCKEASVCCFLFQEPKRQGFGCSCSQKQLHIISSIMAG